MVENTKRMMFETPTIGPNKLDYEGNNGSAFRISGCQLPSLDIQGLIIRSAWDAPTIESRIVEGELQFRFPDEHGPGYIDRLSRQLGAKVTPICPYGLGWKVIYEFNDSD